MGPDFMDLILTSGLQETTEKPRGVVLWETTQQIKLISNVWSAKEHELKDADLVKEHVMYAGETTDIRDRISVHIWAYDKADNLKFSLIRRKKYSVVAKNDVATNSDSGKPSYKIVSLMFPGKTEEVLGHSFCLFQSTDNSALTENEEPLKRSRPKVEAYMDEIEKEFTVTADFQKAFVNENARTKATI
uniref:C2 tensin-type domain-containing protein n=1 Tax=Rhabditophanes sp. KR3021 TaxID=114890 RepID=A0AC35UFN8_9BILA